MQIQTKYSPYKPGRDPSIYPYDTFASLEEQVAQSVEASLRHFTFTTRDSNEPQPTYIDSLLIHSPLATLSENLRVWRVLEGYVPHKIRHLGISNTDLPLLKALYDAARCKPAAVQNRLTDRVDPEGELPVPTPVDVFDEELRMWCKGHNVRYQPWGVVWGMDRVRDSKTVEQLADELQVGKEIVLYLCVLALGDVSIFVGSRREDRMKAAIAGLETWELWMKDGANRSKWEEVLVKLKDEVGLS